MAVRASIFLLSAAALAYEILLMRLLSIIQWQQFAAMIISLALLGYGASGTFITLARQPLLSRFSAAFPLGGILFGLTAIFSFVIAQRLPFNPLELPWNWRQFFLLGALYLLFAVPFFCAATSIGLAFAQAEGKIAHLYRADLAGAGVGAVGILALLGVLTPAQCLRVVALTALAAAVVFIAWARHRWVALICAAVFVLVVAIPPGTLRLRLTEFKPLSQTLRVPGAHITEERSNALGLVSAVESPEVPFRFAPGLSLNFTGELPDQVGLFVDGAALSVISRFDRGRLGFLDDLTSALPYALALPQKVLVLHAGGGMDVLHAHLKGARRIDAVELNPGIIDLVSGRYGEYSGRLYLRPEVHVDRRHPRGFLGRKLAGSYDLIVDSSGAASGVPVLTENYLYTIEGVEELIRHLEPSGLVAITRPMNLPPRDVLKLIATAVLALERQDLRASHHLALIRGWNTVTLLLKKAPLTPLDVEKVRNFCDDHSFDVAYYPGMSQRDANRYNLLDEPFLFDGTVALFSAKRERFLRDYKFNIAPATDDRPFFGHFFKWRTLPELLRLRLRGGAPLLELGYLVVFATLIQSIVAGALLILMPLLVAKRTRLGGEGSARVVMGFASLGLAFLFIEIMFIHKLTLLLGHPLLAIATTLASFLIFAGVGSGISRRLSSRSMWWPVLAICVVVVVYSATLTPLSRIIVPLSTPSKMLIGVLLIAPLGISMGMPFPMAMAAAGERNPAWVPWAWSINGCASVVSPVAATLLAIHLGFRVVGFAAALLYVAAAIAFSGITDRTEPGSQSGTVVIPAV